MFDTRFSDGSRFNTADLDCLKFTTFGLKEDNNIYFSAQNLKKIANHKCFQLEQIVFERSRAIKKYYLPVVEDASRTPYRKGQKLE